MRIFSLSAANLLERLIASGARLRLVGNELQVKGLNREFREEIKGNKQGLMDLVRAGEHKRQPVEAWSYWRDDNWMEGCRLDEPAWTRWKINGQDQQNKAQEQIGNRLKHALTSGKDEPANSPH